MINKGISNAKISQIILASIIIILIYFSIAYLKFFIPGFLGAVTLYILFRKIYLRMTVDKKMNKSLSSSLLIIISIAAIGLPVWWLIDYFAPQLEGILKNQDMILQKFNEVKEYSKTNPILKYIDMSDKALVGLLQKTTNYLPSILNSFSSVLINIIVALFVLYFMQVNNKHMEAWVRKAIPFSNASKNLMWEETNMMVRSNAIGIPVLGFFQGIVAIIGYWIFGVDKMILWGLLTGAATIIPMIGTMVIWVPICIVLLAGGETGNAIGLALYSFILVGGIDNVLRFTILKKLGDVPPLITVFGVILGLNIFGFMGLIFGPLMLSSIGMLFKVYRNEYGKKKELVIPDNCNIIDNYTDEIVRLEPPQKESN